MRSVAQSKKTSRGFEPRSLDSESRVLTVTPRSQLNTSADERRTLAGQKTGKCISRESNPGHIDGNDVFYH